MTTTEPHAEFLSLDQADKVNLLAYRLDLLRRIEDDASHRLQIIASALGSRLATPDDIAALAGCVEDLRDAVQRRLKVEAEIGEVIR